VRALTGFRLATDRSFFRLLRGPVFDDLPNRAADGIANSGRDATDRLKSPWGAGVNCARNSHQISLYGFQSAAFVPVLGPPLVAVLMAVRFQLSCLWLRFTAIENLL
jgi:hypothetical protein